VESTENRHPPSSPLHPIATCLRRPPRAHWDSLKSSPPPPFWVSLASDCPASLSLHVEPQIRRCDLLLSCRDRLDPREVLTDDEHRQTALCPPPCRCQSTSVSPHLIHVAQCTPRLPIMSMSSTMRHCIPSNADRRSTTGT
jgi:hypothetical protein